jgi:nitrogenase molybdenum-iron protein beta chain
MGDFIERSKFSCALGGALSTIAAINKAVPIVHASGGCAASLSGTYNLSAGYRGVGYCGGNMIPTSNISQSNIVFGGEDKLVNQIESTLKYIKGDIYIVVTGCQTEIIGDDAVGIAARYRDQNVIGINTPGFLGNTLRGYDAVLSALVKSFVEKQENKDNKVINLLGIVPGHDVFYRGNIAHLRELLGKIGVKANTFFGDGETVESIKGYGNATLSVVLSETAGQITAKAFETTHKIPYVTTDLPIGPKASERFLRLIADKLGIEKEVVDRVVEEETNYFYSYLERIVDVASDLDFQRYVVTITDSYYAYPIVDFVSEELGWIPHFVSINDLQDKNQQEAYTRKFDNLTSITKPQVIYEDKVGLTKKKLRASWKYNNNEKYYDALSPLYIIGSVVERNLATEYGAGFLSVAFPVSNRAVLNKGYAGFRGALTLVEDLLTNLVASR